MPLSDVHTALHAVVADRDDLVPIIESVAAGAPRGYAVFDTRLEHLWSNLAANNQIARLFDGSLAEELFSTCGAVPRWGRYRAERLGAGAPELIEVSFERATKTARTMVIPVLDPDRNQLGFVFIFLMAEETPEVLFRIETWQALLDTARAAFVLTESTGRMICMSQALVKCFGKPVQKPDFRFPYEALVESGEAESLAEGHRLLLAGQPVSGLTRASFVLADGASCQLAVRWVTLAMGEFPIAKVDLIDTSGLDLDLDQAPDEDAPTHGAAEPDSMPAASDQGAAEVPAPVELSKESLESLSSAVIAAQASPDPLLLVSGVTVSFANQACADLLGVTPEQLTGKGLGLLIGSEAGDPTAIEQTLKRGCLDQLFREQVWLKHLSGRLLPARLHAVPSGDGNSTVITLRTADEPIKRDDLQTVAEMLRTATTASSDSDVIAKPLQLLCETFAADSCELVRFDLDQREPDDAYRTDQRRTGQGVELSQPSEPASMLREVCELLTLTGVPVTIDAEGLSSWSSGSALVTLVPVEDQAMWILYLYSAVKEWSYDDHQRLTHFCQVIAQVAGRLAGPSSEKVS
jgi:PAS domain-containing protein